MVDVCVEECAPAGDYRHFELKEGVNLPDMPRFPTEEFLKQMPPKVRQVVVAIYLAKMVDHLQGIESPDMPVAYRPRRSQVSSQTVADPESEKPPPSPNGAKGSNPGK